MSKQTRTIVFVFAFLFLSLACLVPSLDESVDTQIPTSIPLEQVIAQTASAAQQQTQSFYTPTITMTLPPPTAQGTSTYTPTVTTVSKESYVEWMTNVALTPTIPPVWATLLFTSPVYEPSNFTPFVYSPNSSVPAVLEKYDFSMVSSDSSGAMYFTECGTHAVWQKNKPKSISFFIPAVYTLCDAEGMMKPVVSSTLTLYPQFVTEWLSHMKDERLLRGETVSDVVDGYFLAIYIVPGENTLLYSISAPGEF